MNTKRDTKKLVRLGEQQPNERFTHLHIVDFLGYKYDEANEYVSKLLFDIEGWNRKSGHWIYTKKSTDVIHGVNLIDRYMEITQHWSDIPPLFLKSGAYTILSVCLGRFYDCPDVTTGRLNTWFVLSSIPGRMRRSRALEYVNHTIYHAMMEYYEQVGLTKKEALQKHVISLIEDGTVQGIADSITYGISEKINNFYFSSSEFGGILRKITEGTTNKNVDILLSKLYYGEAHKESLSKRTQVEGWVDRYIPKGTYSVMYSAMQEPNMYLTKEMSRQGLLRRIMIVYIKPEQLNPANWKPPLQRGYKKVWEELEDFGKFVIAPIMIRCHEMQKKFDDYIPLEIGDKSMAFINNEARIRDNALVVDPSDSNIYRQTQWEYISKLSFLDMLSKNEGSPGVMTMDNINEVIPFIQDINKNTEQMIENLGKNIAENQREHDVQRCLLLIKKGGPDGVRWSDICNAFRKRKAEEIRKECMSPLIADGLIHLHTIKSRGRKGERWRHVDYKTS